MTPPQEIEIKLEVDPADMPALTAQVVARLGQGTEPQRLLSVYFDTTSHLLRRNDLTLRVRTIGDRRVQTIKAGEGGSGLFRRDEWEAAIDRDVPDLAMAGATPVPDLLAGAGEQLVPLFETDIRRTTWIVDRGASRIEVALDEGRAMARGRTAPICELELELKHGHPADLFALLRTIDDGARLRIGAMAKSDRGYALLRDKPPRPVKAGPVPLRPGMSTAAALQAILMSCVRQFRLNEPLVVETRDAEGLHQMRVGLRRLRSALSLFENVLADDDYEPLKQRLRAVSRRLGDARDLDVYLERAAAQGDAPPGAAAFLGAIRSRREAAYDALVRTLGEADFRRLMLNLMAWVEAGPWCMTDDPLHRAQCERPFESLLAEVLERRRKAVKTRGRHLDRLDPPDRHRVRIAAKKLRYAAEFAAALVQGRKQKHRHAEFVAALAALQTHLGDLNDIQAGHDLAARIVREMPESGTLLFAAGYVSGEEEAHEDDLLHRAAKAHSAFADADRFWRRWQDPA